MQIPEKSKANAAHRFPLYLEAVSVTNNKRRSGQTLDDDMKIQDLLAIQVITLKS